MQINREAVTRTLLLALVLFAPVALGVLIIHLGIMPQLNDTLYWALLITVGVLWLYGMIEAGSKRGWPEVVLVALTMPFFYFALLDSPVGSVTTHFRVSAFGFLPWLFVLLLVSGHLYGRQIYTAMGACLVVTVFLTVVWYETTVYSVLHRYFQWQS